MARTLPMFPLGSVLVPSMVLPLHIFEPRYRALATRCVEVEPEFGVVLIERGSEVGGGDVRFEVGCLARVVEAAELPDGRWALVAVGTQRLKVTRWLPDDPHPWAEVEAWDDPEPVPGAGGEARLEEVVRLLRRALALTAELGDVVPDATAELTDDVVLGGYQALALAPIGPLDKVKLLAASTPEARLGGLEVLLRDELAVLEQRLADPGA